MSSVNAFPPLQPPEYVGGHAESWPVVFSNTVGYRRTAHVGMASETITEHTQYTKQSAERIYSIAFTSAANTNAVLLILSANQRGCSSVHSQSNFIVGCMFCQYVDMYHSHVAHHPHAPQAAVAGHRFTAGLAFAQIIASEHVTVPSVPEPSGTPHLVSHPLASPTVHTPPGMCHNLVNDQRALNLTPARLRACIHSLTNIYP